MFLAPTKSHAGKPEISIFFRTGRHMTEHRAHTFKALNHSIKRSRFKQVGFPFSRFSVSVVCRPAQLIKDHQLCSLIFPTKQLVSHCLLTPHSPAQTQQAINPLTCPQKCGAVMDHIPSHTKKSICGKCNFGLNILCI